MESATEVRYAGVVVGRAAQVRDIDDAGAFVVFAEPLPVGTLVAFKVGEDERRARVSEVVESANASVAGMRVVFVSATTAAAPPEPAPQASPPAPKPMVAVSSNPAPVAEPAASPPAAAAPVAATEPAAASPVPVAMPEGSGSASSAVPVATAEASGAVVSGAVSAGHPSHDGDGGGRRRRRRR